jgi:ribosomal protein S18 acetylase RimI-like enzyme
MMPIMIRSAIRDDLQHLFDIDLKCFDIPWTIDEWKYCGGGESLVHVATVDLTPVGMVIYHPAECLSIVKLAVKPQFRLRGISRLLLEHCVRCANDNGSQRISITVPETIIYCTDTDNISPWLDKLHFYATTPLLKDHYDIYGRLEDGIVFTRDVPLRKVKRCHE